MQGKLVARARGAYLNRSKHLSRGSVVPAHAADSRDQAGYHPLPLTPGSGYWLPGMQRPVRIRILPVRGLSSPFTNFLFVQ
jgi:hypothetical protein